MKIDVVRNPLNCFSDYGMNNGSERFSEKILDFFDAEEERNLPGNAGKSDAQLRTEYEQKGTHSLKSILSAELTQQIILELLTGHEIFVGMGFCPESNCNPDILMRDRRTGDKFALECKYRFRHYYSEKYHTQTVRWARTD